VAVAQRLISDRATLSHPDPNRQGPSLARRRLTLVHMPCWLRRQEVRIMAKGTEKPGKNNKPKLSTKEKQEKKNEKKKKNG
jgi:hypothetical protein